MREKGQSLFEVILALAVVALILITVVSLAAFSVRNSSYSKNKTIAESYVQQAVEWLRGQRDTNSAFFSKNGNYCLNNLSFAITRKCSDSEKIADTIFKRDLTISKSDVSSKTVLKTEVTVSWSDGQGIHEARSITYFSDWR